MTSTKSRMQELGLRVLSGGKDTKESGDLFHDLLRSGPWLDVDDLLFEGETVQNEDRLIGTPVEMFFYVARYDISSLQAINDALQHGYRPLNGFEFLRALESMEDIEFSNGSQIVCLGHTRRKDDKVELVPIRATAGPSGFTLQATSMLYVWSKGTRFLVFDTRTVLGAA